MKKILIIEDERDTLQMMTAALAHAGYAVSGATNGLSIVDRVRNEKPDLILLDVMLPVFDGYSIALQLAENEETNSIPVIVLTALDASKSLFSATRQVRGFMVKPVNLELLLNAIAQHCVS